MALVGLIHVEEGLEAEELSHASHFLLGHNCCLLMLVLLAATCTALAILEDQLGPFVLCEGDEALPPFHLALLL